MWHSVALSGTPSGTQRHSVALNARVNLQHGHGHFAREQLGRRLQRLRFITFHIDLDPAELLVVQRDLINADGMRGDGCVALARIEFENSAGPEHAGHAAADAAGGRRALGSLLLLALLLLLPLLLLLLLLLMMMMMMMMISLLRYARVSGTIIIVVLLLLVVLATFECSTSITHAPHTPRAHIGLRPLLNRLLTPPLYAHICILRHGDVVDACLWVDHIRVKLGSSLEARVEREAKAQ